MTAVFKDAGSFALRQHENVNTTSTLSVYHSELYIGGAQIHLYDVLANIYVVNGIDQLGAVQECRSRRLMLDCMGKE